MKGFIAGIVITLVVLFGIALAVADLGFMPTRADATPSGFETRMASSALDASMERHALRVKNPIPITDDNLIDGMKIYTMNCAECHGNLDYKPSQLEHAMYPPPPQLILDPMDDPEWHLHYAITTGVRYTGMPAWNKVLTDQDIWKVTAFLSRVNTLPPGAQTYWKNAFGVSPQTHPSQPDHHDHDHD